jgi:glutathione synthase/RimK-type ligase-like ATP-grasp enzyme
MTDLVLVTGQDMPALDDEAPNLVTALSDRGVQAELRVWAEPFDWSRPRLVVVRSTWDYMQRCDEFLTWCREVSAVSKLINPLAVLQWNSHKRYLLELAACGVPVVPTSVVLENSSPAVQRSALAAHDSTVVVKPAIGGGARGTMRARSDAPELAEHLTTWTQWGDVLVQPYVESIATQGETSLLYFAGRFSHAVRKLPVADDYRVQQQYGGRTEPWGATDAELAVADAALAAAPEAVTYARVDLVDIDGRPYLMELELIEPFLFLTYDAGSADRFIEAVVQELP